MIDRWCTSDRGAWKLALNGSTSHVEQQFGYCRYAQASDSWLDDFLSTLLAANQQTTDARGSARASRRDDIRSVDGSQVIGLRPC